MPRGKNKEGFVGTFGSMQQLVGAIRDKQKEMGRGMSQKPKMKGKDSKMLQSGFRKVGK